MAFLDQQPRSADLETATPAELYALSRKKFDALIKSEPAVAGTLFEQLAYTLSRRLRASEAELHILEER